MILDNAGGMVFRPPSEANSFILRVTLGCSHNACTFCSMYRQIKFRVRPLEEIFYLIDKAACVCPETRRVFLADGNALVLTTERLLKIISKLHTALPKLSRITCYGSPKDILGKSSDELKALKNSGLKMIYLGVESGDDQILCEVNKGVTSSEMIRAGRKVLEAGIKLSTMVILGLGGKEYSLNHALNTARIISEINPTFLSTLTLTLYKGTPLEQKAEKGLFVPLTPYETVLELKNMLEHIQVSGPCIFRSNHISNLLPLAGILNRDRNLILSEINSVLEVLEP